MKRPWSQMQGGWNRGGCAGTGRRVRARVGLGAVGLWFLLASAPAWGQPPRAFVPETTERSGLLMRYAGTPEFLPPDPYRDFFYNTRYADSGLVKHPNWVKTQGLYGLGLKTPDTRARLSVLLRHARSKHDRLVEPPVVAARPILPGFGATMAARRDVLLVRLIRADL